MRAARTITSYELLMPLKEAGLLPESCTDVEVLACDGGSLQLRYTVAVQPADIPRFVTALQALDASLHP